MNSSDFDVFNQIFIFQEYRPFRDLADVACVIDLGANVGYSSAYFLSCFPKAISLAVEPDDRNMAICRETLAPFGDRARVLHGAAWSESTSLVLLRGSYRDGREWTTQVALAEMGSTGNIKAWDVGTLIKMTGHDSVDLLKVDIERAELAVFDDSSQHWLPKVHNLCIELHGLDCFETLLRALSSFDYEVAYSEELMICRNLHPKGLSHFANA